MMAKSTTALSTTVLAAITLVLIASISYVNAFQSYQPVVVSKQLPRVKRNAQFTTSTFGTFNINNSHYNGHSPFISMSVCRGSNIGEEGSKISLSNSLFQTASQKSRRTLQKIRRSFTIVLASLAFFLSSTHIVHNPPAHAASTAAAATSLTSLSLTQRLNPFRTRTADEMIDDYVRTKLFADDEYDPVESAYREAFADAAGGLSGKAGGATSQGAYPTLLAETASSALGQTKSVSSLLANSPTVGTTAQGKNDGITAVLIKASDILQSRLKVSASISYYILAATGIVGICVVPTMIGVLYQGIQRAQIDKSEMKMYGKIAE